DIGGRYSALSYFGMVPAAIMGLNIKRLLNDAAILQSDILHQINDNSAFKVGVTLGECANAGRDKVTFVMNDRLSSLGLWIEQLIAESTGKEGKGMLPVAGEQLGDPNVYAADRVFVSVSLEDFAPDVSRKLQALSKAGHPIIMRQLDNVYELGSEFLAWEFATACAGWRLGINPFDQPNVQEAKNVTKKLLHTYSTDHSLPQPDSVAGDGTLKVFVSPQQSPSRSVVDLIGSYVNQTRNGDYIALLSYIDQTAETEALLEKIRLLLRDATRCATTVGFGPRYLHSTGQLHKGGKNTGVFFILTADDSTDFEVPGEPYTFGILKQAQALGDFQALAAHERRVIRIDVGADVGNGLRALGQVISQAFTGKGTSAD
ncbi:MAG: hypothetical protein ABR555_17730, partial [Pyrinomonadaceae bacterium]